MRRAKKEEKAPSILAATTPEGMENELIAMAYELVAQRIQDGTASSAETVHFLKMGSAKERLEKERLKKELDLMQAKTEAYSTAKNIESLYSNAIAAFRTYIGVEDSDE